MKESVDNKYKVQKEKHEENPREKIVKKLIMTIKHPKDPSSK